MVPVDKFLSSVKFWICHVRKEEEGKSPAHGKWDSNLGPLNPSAEVVPLELPPLPDSMKLSLKTSRNRTHHFIYGHAVTAPPQPLSLSKKSTKQNNLPSVILSN